MIGLTWDGFGLTQPGLTAVIQATGILALMTVNAG